MAPKGPERRSPSTDNRCGRPLDELTRRLFSPLHADLARTGWHVLGWDGEQGLCVTLARGEQVLLVELGPRDAALPCFDQTARFNLYVRRLFESSKPLDSEQREVVRRVLGVVRARELLLPWVDRLTTNRRSVVREVEVGQVLIPEGRGQYYLNPYVGCVIGCGFCYVAAHADLSRSLEGLPRIDWGRYVDVKINAPEVLRTQVARATPGIVRISPVLTDPYQPIERHYRITRRCLEVLLEAGFAPVVLTRAARVTDDIDLLARFPRAAVGFSIPTDDDAVRAIFEPGADPIELRLDALRACHQAGIRTFVVVQPMLPMDPTSLVARVAPYVSAARIDRMYQLDRTAPLYREAGLEAAMTDEFFEATAATLHGAFAAHGVPLDELDDLSGLLAR